MNFANENHVMNEEQITEMQYNVQALLQKVLETLQIDVDKDHNTADTAARIALMWVREKFKGRCVCRDGLTPVLDAIRESDGLIIGSPNYLGELTASFRALYERLVFQNLTYNADVPCCNQHPVPVLLIMTSNAPDTMYADLLRNYRQTLTGFVGPTKVLVSGDTLQLKDYSKTDWPWFFDGEAKRKRHETVFPEEMKKAFEMGRALVG